MLSMMDRLWRPDLTEADALDLMHRGIEEVRTKRAGHQNSRECSVLHGCRRRSLCGPMVGRLHLVLLCLMC